MGAVIETEILRKTYGGKVAVGGLDVTVPEGGVFGFLGPNGSGKTTTIRMLLGLVRPTSGRASVLGVASGPALHTVMPRIGAIVESPALFPYLSGRRNLEVLGRIQGIGPAAVSAVLARVGLAARADDRVAKYSLGMKQRLALAAALLKDPALLVLDEPANGLDPQGMKDLRDLITSLGREGRTVFVSSHLLSEIQLMCDRVAIVQGGVTVTQGTVADVLALGRPTGLLVRVPDPDRAIAVLHAEGITAHATGDGSQLRVEMPHDAGARVNEVLARAGLYLSELVPDDVDLETVFLELTRRGEQIPVTYGALFRSELSRLLARRAVRIVAAVAIGLTLLVVVIVAARSTGTGPFDHTMRLRTLWLEVHGETQDTTVLSVAIYLFVLAAALAATAIGGDYRAGTVGTPLTWEPRRVRLVTARLLAIVVVTVGIYLAVTAVLVVGWWLGASLRGSVAVPSRFWPDLARLVVRCTAVTAGFALVTASVVLVTRSTVGGVVAWIGYLVGIEGVLASRISGLRERLLLVNLGAFLEGHPFRYRDAGSVHPVVVRPSDGLVVLVAAVAVAVALGIGAFARRDVA